MKKKNNRRHNRKCKKQIEERRYVDDLEEKRIYKYNKMVFAFKGKEVK